MFLAALWSRCRLVPQSGHACQRTDKPLRTTAPQPLQACEGKRGTDRDDPATGACCLEGERVCELRPRRVMNALRKWAIGHHVPHRQVFDRKKVIPIDKFAALLMSKVAAPPADALVYPRYRSPSSLALAPRRVLVLVLAHPLPHLPSFQIGMRLL